MDRIEIKKGDVVVCVIPEDYGKPRPAIVVQSNLFNKTHSSVTVCPITTDLIDTPLFRLLLIPTNLNGLKSNSHIMVDKISTIRSDKIQKKIGDLLPEEIAELDNAIKLWFNLS